jgi:hypothetical protein
MIMNVIIITLITILNSDISRYGIFIYLPALFFFNASLYLSKSNGIVISIITGLYIDVILTTPLGFHMTLISIFFLIGKNWMIQNSNTKQWRWIIFQLSINMSFHFLLLIMSEFRVDQTIFWSSGRFITDFIISSIVFIPIAFWKMEIDSVVIDIIATKFMKLEKFNEIK